MKKKKEKKFKWSKFDRTARGRTWRNAERDDSLVGARLMSRCAPSVFIFLFLRSTVWRSREDRSGDTFLEIVFVESVRRRLVHFLFFSFFRNEENKLHRPRGERGERCQRRRYKYDTNKKKKKQERKKKERKSLRCSSSGSERATLRLASTRSVALIYSCTLFSCSAAGCS